jgi:2-polyprenyl-3-methyl-5-hydroxy-6-metoxy-1,4-benzoquinol methylase
MNDYLSRLRQLRTVSETQTLSMDAAVAAEIIRHCKGNARRAIRILDVGASDGALLRAVVRSLDEAEIGTRAVALEPDRKSFDALLRADNPPTVEMKHSTLEAFLSNAPVDAFQFDVVLLSHVLYYFAQPMQVVRTLGALLSRPGLLVATLDSHDSELYRLADACRRMEGLAVADQYGTYLSAERFKRDLRADGFRFRESSAEAELHLNTQADLIKTVEFLARRVAVLASDRQRICSAAAAIGLEPPVLCRFPQAVFAIEASSSS